MNYNEEFIVLNIFLIVLELKFSIIILSIHQIIDGTTSGQKFLISSVNKEYSAKSCPINDQLSGEINLMPKCFNERRTDILNEKRVQD